MDKLFDLMSMGVKQQLLLVATPRHMLDVTYTHLDELRLMVDEPSVLACVDDAQRRVVDIYGSMSAQQFVAARQAVARFFQGRRVKVSLFLQGGLQHQDGTFVQFRGGPVPEGGTPPGAIRYFDADGSENQVQPVPALLLATAELPAPSIAAVGVPHASVLGMNIYSRERPAAGRAQLLPGPNSSAAQSNQFVGAPGQHTSLTSIDTAMAVFRHKGGEHPFSPARASAGQSGPDDNASGPAAAGFDPAHESKLDGTQAGMSMLAGMVGAQDDGMAFEMDLFPDAADGEYGTGPDGQSNDIVVLDARDHDAVAALSRDIGLDTGASLAGGDDDEDDDLLAMMDDAALK